MKATSTGWLAASAWVCAAVVAARAAAEACEDTAGQGSSQAAGTHRCGLGAGDKKLLLLSSSGIASTDIKAGLDELVAALPEARGSASRSSQAGPDYAKLKLVTFYDPCMLKRSFWDKDDPDFNQPLGMNYLKAQFHKFQPDDVLNTAGAATNRKLDDGWCEDERRTQAENGGLGDVGFREHDTLSIMDEMMTPEQFKVLVGADLGLEGSEAVKQLLQELKGKAVSSKLLARINAAQVFATSGGNPELMMFVYHAFPQIREAIEQKVMAGQAVYLGRSAGAMVASADVAITTQPTPEMGRTVLQGHSEGLSLLPECILRPHFQAQKHEAAAKKEEKETGKDVVRLPNDQALRCKAGCCATLGGHAAEEAAGGPEGRPEGGEGGGRLAAVSVHVQVAEMR